MRPFTGNGWAQLSSRTQGPWAGQQRNDCGQWNVRIGRLGSALLKPLRCRKSLFMRIGVQKLSLGVLLVLGLIELGRGGFH